MGTDIRIGNQYLRHEFIPGEMLLLADFGIVMGHAPKEVMRHADFVTGSIENDGIYRALKHYRLI